MPKPMFIKNSYSYTFPYAENPNASNVYTEAGSVKDSSAGGATYGYKKGYRNRVHKLAFMLLPQSDRNTLYTFFSHSSSANRGCNQFIYNDRNTTLITELQLNGADGSTTFTDNVSPSIVGTYTVGGNAQLDTAQLHSGTASLLLTPASSDMIQTPSYNFGFGTQDFGISFWIRFSSATGDQTFCGQYVDVNNQWYVIKGSEQKLKMYFASGGTVMCNVIMASAWSVAGSTWYFLEFIRDKENAIIRIDGVAQTLTASTDFWSNSVGAITAPFVIGRYDAGPSNYVNGWIDEFRMTMGGYGRTVRWIDDKFDEDEPIPTFYNVNMTLLEEKVNR